jgi:hypothetical protein
MKTALTLLLVACAATGCASLGSLPSGLQSDPPSPEISGFTPAPAADPFSSPAASIGPTLVIPAAGGPPVLGIPVGGDLFLPVTGGAPVVGISVGP